LYGVARSTVRYHSVRPDQEALRRRIRELAGVRVRSGYRPIHVFLKREGWQVNHKRVYRLYSEEGLTLKPRRKARRSKAAANRKAPALPTAANERWAMDFIHDTLAGGGKIRVLSVIDIYTRECLALAVDTSFKGEKVAAVLSDLRDERGLPPRITVDNGTEFIHFPCAGSLGILEQGRARLHPARQTRGQHVRRGLPRDLSARVPLTDYNKTRPHSSLGQQTPVAFAGGGDFTQGRIGIQNSQS
jgi:putative transposase